MDHNTANHFKQALMARAIELGMDPLRRNTCSPGIKALAQMYAIALRYPHLLQAFKNDFLLHDFRLLSSPHAPDRFVWTIRPCGTTIFFPDVGAGSDFLSFMRISTSSLAFTFDGDKLEQVLNPAYAAQFLEEPPEEEAVRA